MPIPLTPHRDVHPWRLRISLIALALVVVAWGAFMWNHRRAAGMIEHTVNQWMLNGSDDSGPADPGDEERWGRVVPVPAQGADEANAAD